MTDRKILTLYIGAQKTASSVVRRALKDNLAALAAGDVALIDRGVIVNSPFFTFLKTYPSDGTAPAPDAAQLADLHALLDHPHQLTLATSEGMFSSLHADDFFNNIRPGLEMLKRVLPDYDIRVILYVRAQKGFLESCYTQWVQMGRSDLKFEEFLGGGLPDDLSWARVADDIAAVIGRDNLIVRPFEIIKQLGSDGFVRDFLSALGLTQEQIAGFAIDAGLAEGKAANRGFSQAAVDIARFTMPMLKNLKQKKRMRRFLQDNFSTEHYPRPKYFTDAEAAEIKTIYAAENARLFAEYIPGASATQYGYV